MLPTILVVDSEIQARNFLRKKIKQSQIFEVYPEGERFKINEVRFLKKNLTAVFKKKLVVILWWFDTATLEAQNASLKLLEEYADKIDFYLVVKNSNTLLSTILSRSKIKDIRERKEILIKKDYLKFFYSSLNFVEIKNKADAIKFFEDFIKFLAIKAKQTMDIKFAIIGKEAIKVLSLLINNNLNPQLAVDYILIFAWKNFKMKE